MGYLINKDRFNKCYEIIWNCAQTLPYPEFYQAWHSPFQEKQPRWLFFLLCFLLGLVVVFILA
ncbi:hypothetical protein [Dapis sp. BLCC M172]|uniref:hypothetical protein n=1 Tax=Dapis sp. BLCC M172 TaxID=2975281 RepID=UPI003CF552B8